MAKLLAVLLVMCVGFISCSSVHLPEVCHRNPRVNFTSLTRNFYDPSLPPTSADPIKVMLQHRVRDVIKVNDMDRTVSIQVVSYKMWKDPRIKADGPLFVSESFFRDCIWSPTFIHLNLHSHESFNMIKKPYNYMVDGESNVILVGYHKITVGCTMDFSTYPFDAQTCDILEMPMELDTSRLLMEGTTEHDVENQRELQYWVGVSGSPVKQHVISKFNFSTSGSRIQLERRLNVHIMETYIPTVLFVIASWISFLIPPEVVPGRMGMLVTLLLVQVNISLRIASEAPQTPDIPAIATWCLLCIIQTMAAMLQYGYLLYMSRLGLTTIKHSIKVKNNMDKNNGNNINANHSLLPDAASKLAAEVKHRQLRIDKISSIVFPVVSLCITVGYWMYFAAIKYL